MNTADILHSQFSIPKSTLREITMGRTLDTLRHGDTQRSPRTPPADAAPEECVVDWTLQEEVPFVEVGGPGKTIECSPLLVKHPPQAKVQPPHPPVSKGLAAKPTPAVDLTEPEPMAIVFEAWPRPAAPAGIAPEVIAHHQPEHAVSKQYAALFDRMMQTPTPGVLMLCGLRPHVGTTTVLLNLAVTAAHQHRRTVVVDLNVTQPVLAARLGHEAIAGMTDVMAGGLAIGQALMPTMVPELHLLPAGGKGGSVTAEAMAWLASWLRERFDVVLVDGPCVESATALVPHVDDVYLVLPQAEPEGASRGVARSVARMGGRLRGLIHTHFDG
jgi:Mrp family chromosome partitioning ATPase